VDVGDAGEEHPRDRLGQLVQRRDRVVVVLAGEGDLVLGLGQLLLQVEEVRVRLEVRVGLGDGVDLDQRLAELGVRGGLGRDVVALRGGGDGRACLRHLLEDALLMRGVPLDRLDQVGDQVGAPGQLHVDAAQCLLGADVGRAQLVEADDHEADQGHDHDDDDDDGDEHLNSCG